MAIIMTVPPVMICVIILCLNVNVLFVRLLVFRIVSMVMTLREWAQKSLADETERPDSFLERFRGPAHMDPQGPPSRFSHSHAGSDADGENRRTRRR